MTLIQAYENAIQRGDINEDLRQREVLLSMQRLLDELQKPRRFWFHWGHKTQPMGLYLYGPVGVGKTYLMDLFYQQVSERQKARFHFHHFMQQIDAQLRRRQGQKNPLQAIAADLAKTVRLLCFDEFLVHDVAHAMILKELLQALFANGIVLVATSNTRPEELYWNGVQRARFLPAIALIKTHCEELCLNEKKDYRVGRMPLLTSYFCPLNEENEQRMLEQFALLATKTEESGFLSVQNRDIPFIRCAERVIWFDFKVICNLPRSQLDYLELADRFDTIFIANIPQLRANDTIHAILLVHFVDVMYDRGIKIVISAAVPAEQLYTEGEMAQTFKRTLSRLLEMQSADYQQRHPRREVEDLQS